MREISNNIPLFEMRETARIEFISSFALTVLTEILLSKPSREAHVSIAKDHG